MLEREKESTTGVGDGIAIPHGRCDGVRTPGLVAMVIPDGVEYEALDDEPVNLLFLIAANPQSGSAHIDILSKLSGMLMHDEFTSALKSAKTPEEFLQIIDDAEAEKDEKTKETVVTDMKQKKILAVTGCPTSIAHTLMAPHGGIFVFPVVGNALLYVVALLVGTVVSTLLLGLLKKKVAA